MTETIEIVIASAGAGGVSSLCTVAALKVHIKYLKEMVEQLQKRVDRLELRGANNS